MHSRIKELALEAGIVLKRPSKSWSKNPDWMKTNPNMPMEKFAELLIRECADLCYDEDFATGGGYARAIMRKFGVTE